MKYIVTLVSAIGSFLVLLAYFGNRYSDYNYADRVSDKELLMAFGISFVIGAVAYFLMSQYQKDKSR